MCETIRKGWKLKMNEKGEVFKRYPAVRSLTRMSDIKYKRLLRLLKLFKQGWSIQQIAIETTLDKRKIYQEMYHLKNLGLLPEDFKNPKTSVWSDDIVKKLRKEAGE